MSDTSYREIVRFFQVDGKTDRLSKLLVDFLNVFSKFHARNSVELIAKGWRKSDAYTFVNSVNEDWIGRLLIYLGIDIVSGDQVGILSLDIDIESVDDVYLSDESLFVSAISKDDVGVDAWIMLAQYYDLDFHLLSVDIDNNIYINTDVKREYLPCDMEIFWKDANTGLQSRGHIRSKATHELLSWLSRMTPTNVGYRVFGEHCGNLAHNYEASYRIASQMTIGEIVSKFNGELQVYPYEDLDSLRYVLFEERCLESYGSRTLPYHYTTTQKLNLF